MSELTQKELKRILNYDHATGDFTWLVRINQGIRAGDIAGCLHPSGYWFVGYKYKSYPGHRLAFLYMDGEIPPMVDHIDQNKANNAWGNLRAATNSQNQSNTGAYANNATGYKGVNYHKGSGKLHSRIRHNKKLIFLGVFDSPEEAAIAYNEKALELHGEFACLNIIKEPSQ